MIRRILALKVTILVKKNLIDYNSINIYAYLIIKNIFIIIIISIDIKMCTIKIIANLILEVVKSNENNI